MATMETTEFSVIVLSNKVSQSCLIVNVANYNGDL